jgi:hypothetical protein
MWDQLDYVLVAANLALANIYFGNRVAALGDALRYALQVQLHIFQAPSEKLALPKIR